MSNWIMPQEMIERLPHYHQWFSTGEMKPGQIRCIECGKWGETYDAEKAQIEQLEVERDEDVALLRECLLFTMSRSLDMHRTYMRNVLKARLEKEQ